MGFVLFWLTVACTIGLALFPLLSRTRGSALWGVFSQLCGGVGFTLWRTEYFPEWVKPEWSQSLAWSLASWALLVIGLIIALKKPRKKNPTAA